MESVVDSGNRNPYDSHRFRSTGLSSHGRSHRFESCAAHSTYDESRYASVQNYVQNVMVRERPRLLVATGARKTFPGPASFLREGPMARTARPWYFRQTG